MTTDMIQAIETDGPIGFVYMWTNTINGKRYIGAHVGRPDDGYIGSGVVFRRAWRTYGPDAFVRELLHVEYEDADNVWAIEHRIIEEYGAVDDHSFYNLSMGGKLPPSRVPAIAQRISKSLTGRTRSELSPEVRAGMADRARALGRSRRGWQATTDQRAAMSVARKGRTLSDEARANISSGLKGRKQTPESVELRAAAIRGRPSKLRGVPRSPESTAKCAESLRGVPKTEQHRAAIAAAQQERRRRERAERADGQLELKVPR